MCPINHVFEYHRNNEFMFLMLGESVLQMVISQRYEQPSSFGHSIWSRVSWCGKLNALLIYADYI